jgi:uncharacterized membrane protein YdjX (TVP38/TMEM64 family)
MRGKIKAVIGIIVIMILFIFLSYLIQTNENRISSIIGDSFFGMIIFVVVFAISIVVAPVSAVPLMPLGVGLWGVLVAVFLGVIGWTFGAIIAFIIARKYGVPLVKKLISIEDIYRWERKIPQENLFLTVLFLRMILPFDGLSYAVGLFTKMKFWPYFLATIFGLIPLTIIIAYFGKIDYRFQIIGFLIIINIVLMGILVKQNRRIKKRLIKDRKV